MNEYDEYDTVYYDNDNDDDIPRLRTYIRRKPSRYDLDTLTPAEIEAYDYYEYDKFSS